MQNSIKIIVFEDNEQHQIWLHTNQPSTIMHFSKGFSDDPDRTIHLTGTNGSWQFGGVDPEDALDKDEFETLWQEGMDFKNNPDRVLKEQQKESLEEDIKKAEKLLKHYKDELEKL